MTMPSIMPHVCLVAPVAVFEVLLHNRHDLLYLKDKEGDTPLHKAAQKGSVGLWSSLSSGAERSCWKLGPTLAGRLAGRLFMMQHSRAMPMWWR
mmetsp:Transcript_20922/g.51009  ORF Transcript_20922/g.51009 Transcript_20922/m.51009 type:complete len:94 (-) Transcript_20922:211-492(-)